MKFLLLATLGLLVSCSHPITATNQKVGNDKGEACSRNILFIIPLSFDRSIHTAAENGNLEYISTVDSSSIFTGIYNQTCTIVYGHRKTPGQAEEKVTSSVMPVVPVETNEKTE